MQVQGNTQGNQKKRGQKYLKWLLTGSLHRPSCKVKKSLKGNLKGKGEAGRWQIQIRGYKVGDKQEVWRSDI